MRRESCCFLENVREVENGQAGNFGERDERHGTVEVRLDVVRDATQSCRWKAIGALPHVKSTSSVRVEHMCCEGDTKRLSEEAAPRVSSLQLVAEREGEMRDERILGCTRRPRFEFARSRGALGDGDERLGTEFQ